MMGVLRMKINAMGKGESSVTYNYSVWEPQALFIKWVVENQPHLNQHNVKLGAYMNLTGSMCSLVESVCEFVLIENLTSNHQLSEHLNRVNLRSEVNGAQWKNYDSLFKKIFDQNISFYANNIRNVDYLFKLRNSIIHGNKLQLVQTYGDTNERAFQIKGGKYQDVYNFLKEKNIIFGGIYSVNSDPSIIFSDSVINYFIVEVVKFITLLHDSELLQDFERKLIDSQILSILPKSQ